MSIPIATSTKFLSTLVSEILIFEIYDFVCITNELRHLKRNFEQYENKLKKIQLDCMVHSLQCFVLKVAFEFN